MSYDNQLKLKVNVSKFVTQIQQSENLVFYNVALEALGICTVQGNHPVIGTFCFESPDPRRKGKSKGAYHFCSTLDHSRYTNQFAQRHESTHANKTEHVFDVKITSFLSMRARRGRKFGFCPSHSSHFVPCLNFDMYIHSSRFQPAHYGLEQTRIER